MKKMKWMPFALLVILCADMAMATRLNSPYTVYTHNISSKDIYEHSREFPHGFPLPDMENVIENRDTKIGYKILWRNTNTFYKKISYQGYSPFQLKEFVNLQDNHPLLYETVLQHPPLYLSGKISLVDSIPAHERENNFDRNRTYLETTDWKKYHNRIETLSPGDTAFFRSFSPIEIKARCINQGEAILNLLQFNYYGWRATIDGKDVDILPANLGLISLAVPGGDHEVVFEYRPKDVIATFYVSLVFFLAGLGLAIFYFFKG